MSRNALYNIGFAALVTMLLGSIMWVGCMRGPEAIVQTAAVAAIQTEAITVSPIGAIASDTTASGPIMGEIIDVYIDYGSTMSTTTDITLTYSSPFAMGQILEVLNNVADGVYMPRATAVTSANVALASYWPFYCNGSLLLSVGGTLSGTSATAYVRFIK